MGIENIFGGEFLPAGSARCGRGQKAAGEAERRPCPGRHREGSICPLPPQSRSSCVPRGSVPGEPFWKPWPLWNWAEPKRCYKAHTGGKIPRVGPEAGLGPGTSMKPLAQIRGSASLPPRASCQPAGRAGRAGRADEAGRAAGAGQGRHGPHALPWAPWAPWAPLGWRVDGWHPIFIRAITASDENKITVPFLTREFGRKGGVQQRHVRSWGCNRDGCASLLYLLWFAVIFE